MWQLALAGLLIGIFAGPAIIYGVGTLVVMWREYVVQKQIAQMVALHNAEIKQIKKQYETSQKRFSKCSREIQKIIAKVKKG